MKGMNARAVFVFSCLVFLSISQVRPQDALAVEDLTVEGNRVHFKLLNVSGRPIMAWQLTVAGTINGETVRRTFGHDFAGTTWLRKYQPANAFGAHRAGAVEPGGFHEHSISLMPGKQDKASQVSVKVLSVVFADGQVLGDNRFALTITKDREKSKEKLGQIVHELQASYAKGKPVQEMKRLEEKYAKALNWPAGTQAPIFQREQLEQAGLLRELRRSLKLLTENPDEAPDASFADLIERVKKQRESFSISR